MTDNVVIMIGVTDNLRFYVLLTIFQSYQDDGMVTMKCCV